MSANQLLNASDCISSVQVKIGPLFAREEDITIREITPSNCTLLDNVLTLTPGVNVLLFGCYNLGGFNKMKLVNLDTRIFPTDEDVIVTGLELENAIALDPIFGDQNYAAELCVNPDDKEPWIHVDRQCIKGPGVFICTPTKTPFRSDIDDFVKEINSHDAQYIGCVKGYKNACQMKEYAAKNGWIDIMNDKYNNLGLECIYKANMYEEEVKEVEEEEVEEEVKEEDQCVICFGKKADNKVLVPCGHTSYCNECIEKIDSCSICRGKIENVLTTY